MPSINKSRKKSAKVRQKLRPTEKPTSTAVYQYKLHTDKEERKLQMLKLKVENGVQKNSSSTMSNNKEKEKVR